METIYYGTMDRDYVSHQKKKKKKKKKEKVKRKKIVKFTEMVTLEYFSLYYYTKLNK